MTIYIAADHTGLTLKEDLKAFLSEMGHTVEDMGAHVLDTDDDYPDIIAPCAAQVARDPESLGVVIGGSGHGEAMVANRIAGARAATFYGPRAATNTVEHEGTASADDYDIVRVARMHNNANILSIGTRFVSSEEAKRAAEVFIETPFGEGERHMRRIAKF